MDTHQLHRRLTLTGIALLSVLLVSCSSKHYRKSADKETASVFAEKVPLVQNMDTNFTVLPNGRPNLDIFPAKESVDEFFGPEADFEKEARVITLEEALALAVKHSPTYQARKETLFLRALSLTLARHRFSPIFSSRGSSAQNRSTTGVNQIVEQRTFTGTQRTDFNALSRAGTRIGTAFTTDFLRFLTGDPTLTTSSALAGTLTQPLLRGAGHKIAAENLTQAERDFLYALRDFTRYRKDFSVTIASSYYNVLQNRDAVRNSWRGYQNFQLNVARERAFAEQGMRAQAQLDQLEQARLTSESRWINAVRVYRQSLDQFKLQLGLPVDATIVLSDKELEELEVVDPQLTPDEALEIALLSRLDLETDRDRVVDAERHIAVAANGFLPRLDMVGGARVTGSQQRSGVANPDWNRYQWNAGLDADLPFDRKAERNSYRAAIVAHEAAKRQLNVAIDNIKLQLADD
ncbi:MAG: TolC family protein, partial [Limisphaerales bacterium]